MTKTSNDIKIFDQAIFALAKDCGKADGTAQGKLQAFGQLLLPHVKGMAYKPAMEFFQSSDKTGNGGGKRIREDFLNGYAVGRGWTSYSLASDSEKATARKCFARAVETVAPKPSKAENKIGGAMSQAAANANQESASSITNDHAKGRDGIHIDSIAAFMSPGGVMESALVALSAYADGKEPRERVTPNMVRAWATAATTAQSACAQLKKAHTPNH